MNITQSLNEYDKLILLNKIKKDLEEIKRRQIMIMTRISKLCLLDEKKEDE